MKWLEDCEEICERHGPNPLGQREGDIAGMHDVKTVQLKIGQRRPHGGSDPGCARSFNFEAEAVAAMEARIGLLPGAFGCVVLRHGVVYREE